MKDLPFKRQIQFLTFIFFILFLFDFNKLHAEVFLSSGTDYILEYALTDSADNSGVSGAPGITGITDISTMLGVTVAKSAKSSKSSKSKKSKKNEEVQKTEEPSDDDFVEDPNAVRLNVPKKYVSTFFRGISENIIKQIELGTPDSIVAAVNMLKKPGNDYTEAEKTLFYVADGIMRIVWPTEKRSWEVYPLAQDNAYAGAVNSAEKGVYDFSTGDMDFLTLTLPSLVLLTNNSRNDYYTVAQNSLLLAVKINEDSVLANYLLGVLYTRMQQSEAAQMYLRKAWESSKNYLQTSYAYAENLYGNGQFRQAAEIAENLVSFYPKDINLLKLCAKTMFAQKRFQDSELYVARVLQQNPADSEYILFRAKILVEEGDFIKASSLLDVYSRTDNSSKDYLLLRSRVLSEWNKNTRAAVENIEKAIEKYPEDLQVLLAACSLASAAGEKIGGKSAGDLARQVLVLESENSIALEISIKDLMENKKWEEAYNLSRKIIAKSEATLEAKQVHVTICLTLDKKEEAWQLARQLYESFPKDELALKAYLEVLYAQNRRSESMEIIEKLLPSSTSHLKSFLYYRRSFLQGGEQSVLADLRSSLIANSRNEDSLFRLYSIYYDKKDYRRAQYYLKQVVALHPTNSDLLRRNAELEQLL